MTVAYTVDAAPCDRCGRPAYTITNDARRHPCCDLWWADGWRPDRVAKGRDCPACLDSDEHARKNARRSRT